ncbi:hypothetical protein CTA2_3639 [Colletotrichum tanaceti]|uniref:Secreted protein n=1 Tax=Colletotrichum tanaceti TaxID=1306861 RepID=A0A4U6XHP2_9PEZI|nr:hypothetical protein CTA2_3639 [Colletotrichum tanaceti]TKW55335.1 hypothetical protein CTA1_12763 [Colletotrichum tanaceti]
MRSILVFLAALLHASSLAEGFCFSEGRRGTYHRNQDVLDLVDVCNQLNGTYDRTQVKRFCATDKNQVSWGFELKMIGADTKRDISTRECMGGMTKELTCKEGRGGVTTYWNWRYKAKPNYVADECFPRPYWKPIDAYDPQDEPERYLCRVMPHSFLGCWDDSDSVPVPNH